jgi:hypothetical protein
LYGNDEAIRGQRKQQQPAGEQEMYASADDQHGGADADMYGNADEVLAVQRAAAVRQAAAARQAALAAAAGGEVYGNEETIQRQRQQEQGGAAEGEMYGNDATIRQEKARAAAAGQPAEGEQVYSAYVPPKVFAAEPAKPKRAPEDDTKAAMRKQVWVNAAVEVQFPMISFYIDGKCVHAALMQGSCAASSALESTLTIGRFDNSSKLKFGGELKNLRITHTNAAGGSLAEMDVLETFLAGNGRPAGVIDGNDLRSLVFRSACGVLFC